MGSRNNGSRKNKRRVFGNRIAWLKQLEGIRKEVQRRQANFRSVWSVIFT